MKSFQDYISEDAPGAIPGVATHVSQTGGSDTYDIQYADVL